MSRPSGGSQNFGTFNFGDPYSLRAFSDAVHDLIQNEFAAKGELFPAPNRLNATLRQPISEQLFGRHRRCGQMSRDKKRKGEQAAKSSLFGKAALLAGVEAQSGKGAIKAEYRAAISTSALGHTRKASTWTDTTKAASRMLADGITASASSIGVDELVV